MNAVLMACCFTGYRSLDRLAEAAADQYNIKMQVPVASLRQKPSAKVHFNYKTVCLYATLLETQQHKC